MRDCHEILQWKQMDLMDNNVQTRNGGKSTKPPKKHIEMDTSMGSHVFSCSSGLALQKFPVQDEMESAKKGIKEIPNHIESNIKEQIKTAR